MRTAFVLFFIATIASCKPLSKQAALDYLQTFGYLQPEQLSADGSSEEEIDMEIRMETAVRKFQQRAGLQNTGDLDALTLEKMSQPRCGVPDFAALVENSDYDEDNRQKWSKELITYSIENYWPGLSEGETRRAMWEAFQEWEQVIPLKFRETHPGHGDIKIKFGRKEHGGCNPFDGKAGTLAHAYYPEVGMLHFDADENWIRMDENAVVEDFSKIDIFWVAIHEIGHVLGVKHSHDATSIMAPYYQTPVDENGNYVRPELDEDSIRKAQSLYGKVDSTATHAPNHQPAPRPTVAAPHPSHPKEDSFPLFPHLPSLPPPPAGPPSPKPEPNLPEYCLRSVVAIARIPDNRILVFPDSKHIITVNSLNKHIIAKRPVSDMFLVRPFEVNAAVYSVNDSMLLLFNGNLVFGYDLKNSTLTLAHGYPKILKTHLAGDPLWETDSAFILPDGRRVLISANKRFAFYNEQTNAIKIMADSIQDHFPNMPEDVVGFVDFHQGTHVGFTATDVFKYDFETHTTENLGKIHDHMGC